MRHVTPARFYEQRLSQPRNMSVLFAIARTLVLRQVAFAQANILRRDLDQFIVIDEVQRLLQAHKDRRREAHGDIGSRGADIGLLLLFADCSTPQTKKTLALGAFLSQRCSILSKRQRTTSSFE